MKVCIAAASFAVSNLPTAFATSAAVRSELGYARFEIQNMTSSVAGKIVGLQGFDGLFSRINLSATPLELRMFSLSLHAGLQGAFARTSASNAITSLKAELLSVTGFLSVFPAIYLGTFSLGVEPGLNLGGWNKLRLSVVDQGVSGSAVSSIDVRESLLTFRINKDTGSKMTFGLFAGLAKGKLSVTSPSNTYDYRCYSFGANFEYRFVEPDIILTLSRGKSLSSMK